MNLEQVKPNRGAEPAVDKVRDIAESKDKLMKDFRALLAEGETLVRSAAGTGDDALAAARDKFKSQLDALRQRYEDLQDTAVRRARRAAAASDEYVHENPWTAIGVACGVGLLLGMLIASRR